MTRTGFTWTFTFICVLSLLAGCDTPTDPLMEKLAGTWVIKTVDSVLERVNQEVEDSESTKVSESRMTIMFSTEGVLETETKMGQLDVKKSGTWSIVSFDESKSVLNIHCTLAGQESNHRVELLDEDSIRLIPPNMAGVDMKLEFRRRK